LDDLSNPRAIIGGNNPPYDPRKFAESAPYDPEILAQCVAKVAEFTATADEWAKLSRLEDNAQAKNLTDYMGGLGGVHKLVDAARIEFKRVFDALGDQVQAAFGPLVAKLKAAATVGKGLQADWLIRERAIIAAEKAEAMLQAQIAKADAEKAAALAQANGSISGKVEAEILAKEALAMEKSAARVVKPSSGSASGGARTVSLRSRKVAEIHSQNGVYMHFRGHPKVVELLQVLANEAVRSGVTFDAKILTVQTVETAA
jgi:hypothetical protein